MRHLYGVVLAAALAGAVFFGAAWGYLRVNRAIEAGIAASSGLPAASGGGLPAAGGTLFRNANLLTGGGALLAAALAAGLLMTLPRVSPLAAGLPGLILVAWTALYVADVRDAVRLIPMKDRDFGVGFESLLFTGLLGAAGLAMMIPLFIPSRWRRPSRVLEYAAPGGSTLLGQSAAVAPGVDGSGGIGGLTGIGGAGLNPTIVGLSTSFGGDGNAPPPDWAQTLPLQGRIIPPGRARAPWDPPDQG